MIEKDRKNLTGYHYDGKGYSSVSHVSKYCERGSFTNSEQSIIDDLQKIPNEVGNTLSRAVAIILAKMITLTPA